MDEIEDENTVIIVSREEFEKLLELVKKSMSHPYPDTCRCGQKAGHLGWNECFHKALEELGQ